MDRLNCSLTKETVARRLDFGSSESARINLDSSGAVKPWKMIKRGRYSEGLLVDGDKKILQVSKSEELNSTKPGRSNSGRRDIFDVTSPFSKFSNKYCARKSSSELNSVIQGKSRENGPLTECARNDDSDRKEVLRTELKQTVPPGLHKTPIKIDECNASSQKSPVFHVVFRKRRKLRKNNKNSNVWKMKLTSASSSEYKDKKETSSIEQISAKSTNSGGAINNNFIVTGCDKPYIVESRERKMGAAEKIHNSKTVSLSEMLPISNIDKGALEATVSAHRTIDASKLSCDFIECTPNKYLPAALNSYSSPNFRKFKTVKRKNTSECTSERMEVPRRGKSPRKILTESCSPSRANELSDMSSFIPATKLTCDYISCTPIKNSKAGAGNVYSSPIFKISTRTAKASQKNRKEAVHKKMQTREFFVATTKQNPLLRHSDPGPGVVMGGKVVPTPKNCNLCNGKEKTLFNLNNKSSPLGHSNVSKGADSSTQRNASCDFIFCTPAVTTPKVKTQKTNARRLKASIQNLKGVTVTRHKHNQNVKDDISLVVNALTNKGNIKSPCKDVKGPIEVANLKEAGLIVQPSLQVASASEINDSVNGIFPGQKSKDTNCPESFVCNLTATNDKCVVKNDTIKEHVEPNYYKKSPDKSKTSKMLVLNIPKEVVGNTNSNDSFDIIDCTAIEHPVTSKKPISFQFLQPTSKQNLKPKLNLMNECVYRKPNATSVGLSAALPKSLALGIAKPNNKRISTTLLEVSSTGDTRINEDEPKRSIAPGAPGEKRQCVSPIFKVINSKRRTSSYSPPCKQNLPEFKPRKRFRSNSNSTLEDSESSAAVKKHLGSPMINLPIGKFEEEKEPLPFAENSEFKVKEFPEKSGLYMPKKGSGTSISFPIFPSKHKKAGRLIEIAEFKVENFPDKSDLAAPKKASSRSIGSPIFLPNHNKTKLLNEIEKFPEKSDLVTPKKASRTSGSRRLSEIEENPPPFVQNTDYKVEEFPEKSDLITSKKANRTSIGSRRLNENEERENHILFVENTEFKVEEFSEKSSLLTPKKTSVGSPIFISKHKEAGLKTPECVSNQCFLSPSGGSPIFKVSKRRQRKRQKHDISIAKPSKTLYCEKKVIVGDVQKSLNVFLVPPVPDLGLQPHNQDTEVIEEFGTEALHMLSLKNSKDVKEDLNEKGSENFKRHSPLYKTQSKDESEGHLRQPVVKKSRMGPLQSRMDAVLRRKQSERRARIYEQSKLDGPVPGFSKDFRVLDVRNADFPLRVYALENDGVAVVVINKDVVASTNSIYPGCWLKIFPPCGTPLDGLTYFGPCVLNLLTTADNEYLVCKDCSAGIRERGSTSQTQGSPKDPGADIEVYTFPIQLRLIDQVLSFIGDVLQSRCGIKTYLSINTCQITHDRIPDLSKALVKPWTSADEYVANPDMFVNALLGSSS